VLVLPEPFTDGARLVLLDLDVAAEVLRGAALGWFADAQAWRLIELSPS
jgi:hypothetical protein